MKQYISAMQWNKTTKKNPWYILCVALRNDWLWKWKTAQYLPGNVYVWAPHTHRSSFYCVTENTSTEPVTDTGSYFHVLIQTAGDVSHILISQIYYFHTESAHLCPPNFTTSQGLCFCFCQGGEVSTIHTQSQDEPKPPGYRCGSQECTKKHWG